MKKKLLSLVLCAAVACSSMAALAETNAESKDTTYKTVGTIYDGETMTLDPDTQLWNVGFMKPGAVDTADKVVGNASYKSTAEGAENMAIWFAYTAGQVMDGIIDASNVENPAISFWFKASDLTKIKDNMLRVYANSLGTTGQAAKSVCYNIDTTTLKEGWNNIVLPLFAETPGVETMTVNGIKIGYTHYDVDMTKLSAFQFEIESTAALETWFDDIRIVDLDKAEIKHSVDTEYATVGTIFNGDALHPEGDDSKWTVGGWGSDKTINTEDKKEGAGSYEYTVTGTVGVTGDYNMYFHGDDQANWTHPIDISNVKNAALSFWFWIEDASQLKGDITILLDDGSSENMTPVAGHGYMYYLHNSSIQDGWNKIVLPIYAEDIEGSVEKEFLGAKFGYNQGVKPTSIFAIDFNMPSGANALPANTVLRYDDVKIVDLDKLASGEPAKLDTTIVLGEGGGDTDGPTNPDGGDKPVTGDVAIPVAALALAVVSTGACLVLRRKSRS